MDFENICYEKQGHIATLTLNRPPANSVNIATLVDIEAALDNAEQDKDVRVLIITGAGEKGFSAGFDVSDVAKAHIAGPKGQEVWTKVDRFPKPVIAAINGYAFGGGCELAMAATFRVMQEGAKIGLTELNLGIIPGWGGTQRMPRILGKSKALELILFSKRLTAREALEIGLVDRVSAEGELMKDVMGMAEFLAQRPPLAVMAVLKAVTAGLEKGLDEGTKVEWEGTQAVSSSKDAIEGFTAFMEKRAPNFKGE
ncbi:MAG: enoyl-CoA hydratase/isomerase family protein [Deltaproteobacteria bacterium]|nr:enoyl-CoA hydratase/isomerase family protein [Deltaproteobacteria bacterium]MBW2594948.1 enoyl-CoA hydratase/isomerase family protein [Deltaproteobacteria bacterium]MBW2649716.1 enoyl-CoA hydratase/isomerase family protein [Deltaproteobacteria bacterium]